MVEVDVEPDFESSTQIDWVIGVVDRVDFIKIAAQESAAISTVKSAEKRRKREEPRATLVADAGDELKALPIYNTTIDNTDDD